LGGKVAAEAERGSKIAMLEGVVDDLRRSGGPGKPYSVGKAPGLLRHPPA
jgi:hypothetical protein